MLKRFLRPTLILFNLVVCLVLAIGLFGVSCWQSISHEETKRGSKIVVTGHSTWSACRSATGFSTHRPFRFRFNVDPEYLYCGWPMVWTAVRLGLAVAMVICCLVGLFGMLKKNKTVITVLSFFLSLTTIASGVVLGADLFHGLSGAIWCARGMPGVSVSSNFTCNSWPYFVMMAVDLIAVIGFVWCTGYLIYFLVKFWNTDIVKIDMRNDPNTPLAQPVSSSNEI